MILITGCARSGTSLTTKILQAHGCWLGEARQVNVLYENTDVREQVLKPYLRFVNADPLGQSRLPDTANLPMRPGFAAAIQTRIGGTEPRAYKDAKISLVWPAFAWAFPDAKWVLVRRDAERIVDSCMRTSFMRAHGSDRDGWRGWVGEHETRFEAMKAAGLELIEVWPADYIADPGAFRPVVEHCGMAFDRAAIEAAVDSRQWHG